MHGCSSRLRRKRRRKETSMSKAVLISIRPEWCEKIIKGQKTIEVRKTRPKMNPPFKCYIYRSVQGGVIGEFVCDHIFERIVRVGTSCEAPKYCICDWNMYCTPLDTLLADACLTKDELEKYLDGGVGYGWHISNLRIYDHPRDLWEFTGLRQTKSGLAPGPITRPPQSWRYVEEELWDG